MKSTVRLLCLFLAAGLSAAVLAQTPQEAGGPPGGRGGFGPGGMGPGGPRESLKLVKKFDQDENGWLDRQERIPARVEAKAQGNQRGGFGPPDGGPRGMRGRGNSEPAKPGRKVTPDQVERFPAASLYEPTVLRTLFLQFENDDWEQELEDFHGTDVDIPATLSVDGKTYSNVGVRFRGMSSYGMVPAGYKRSFNVAMDMADKDQDLYGYKTLNLLNSAGDPSFLSTVLYSHIASQYIPAPQANHVHVVINGESWGLYVSVQQFDKKFLAEHFDSTQGTRWKVSGSPGGDGGLRYLGDELEPYKQRFDMKSNDGKKAWIALIDLCRTLNETPLEQLENALDPMLDIDETLRFLALDVALVNSDGYWTRASDYSLFLDKDKRFHIFPHDMNEAFASGRGPGGPGGPGGIGGPPPGEFGPPPDGRGFGPPPGFEPPPEFDPSEGFDPDNVAPRRNNENSDRSARQAPNRQDQSADPAGRRFNPRRGPRGFRGGPGGPGGGPGHGSVDLDPLISIDNPRMPLRSQLLAVPSLREKYLQYVREIAEKSLDWKQIEPVFAAHVKLIESEVAADTRKLSTLEAFQNATALQPPTEKGEPQSLRGFFEQRRAFLLADRTPREDSPPQK